MTLEICDPLWKLLNIRQLRTTIQTIILTQQPAWVTGWSTKASTMDLATRTGDCLTEIEKCSWNKFRNTVQGNILDRTLEIHLTSLDFQLALVGGSVWGNYGAMNVIYGVALVPKTFKLSLHRLNNPMKHFHKSAIQTQAVFTKIKVFQNYQENIIFK